MRRITSIFITVLLLAGLSEAANAHNRTRKLTEKSILQTVKRLPHLRTYYTKDERGKKVLVVTNRVRAGAPQSVERGLQKPIDRQQQQQVNTQTEGQKQLNTQTPAKGIPYDPKRNPQRVINPYKKVNPFRDPTAIPTGPPPD